MHFNTVFKTNRRKLVYLLVSYISICLLIGTSQLVYPYENTAAKKNFSSEKQLEELKGTLEEGEFNDLGQCQNFGSQREVTVDGKKWNIWVEIGIEWDSEGNPLGFAELAWQEEDEEPGHLFSRWESNNSENHDFKIEFGSNGEVLFYEKENETYQKKETLDWDNAGIDQDVIDKAKENKFKQAYAQNEHVGSGDIPGTSNDPGRFKNMQFKEDGDWSDLVFNFAVDFSQGQPIDYDCYTCNGKKIYEFKDGRKVVYSTSEGWVEIYEGN